MGKKRLPNVPLYEYPDDPNKHTNKYVIDDGKVFQVSQCLSSKAAAKRNAEMFRKNFGLETEIKHTAIGWCTINRSLKQEFTDATKLRQSTDLSQLRKYKKKIA